MNQLQKVIIEESLAYCCVCDKKTKFYCPSCCEHNDDGTISPVCFFCEGHYKSVVLTGNCCSGNEEVFN